MSIGKEFLRTAIQRMRYYRDLGEKTFGQLNDADLYFQSNDASNSIATIIQHLSGNMLSRWTNFLSEDGEKDWRQRDKEFAVDAHDKQYLVELWNKGWDCFLNSLASLTEEDLLRTVLIRREGLLVVDAINRQLAHYPYHVGQIVYLGKLIRNGDWNNLSIPVGGSLEYNQGEDVKDPAKKFG